MSDVEPRRNDGTIEVRRSFLDATTHSMVWWLEAALAAVPIFVILVAMVFFKRSAATAGIVGLGLTLVITVGYFGFPDLAAQDRPIVSGLTGALAEATFTAGTILWIIFGALCLHQLQMATDAIEVLREHLGRLTEDPRLLAILIAWFFALFLEGAAGFGTPIALAAPFLVGFGFSPVQAVTIALIGHSVGVSFGAVGTPIIPQIAVTEFTGLAIAGVTADFHALLGWVMLAVVLILVGRTTRTDSVGRGSVVGWFLLAAAGVLLPMWLVAQFVGPELPTMGGAVVGAAVFIVVLQKMHRTAPNHSPTGEDEVETTMPLWQAASPYIVVIALVLVTRLIVPVKSALRAVEISWQLFGQFEGSFQPLYHPGTILVIGFSAGALFQGATSDHVRTATRKAVRMLVPVTVALVAMLAISRLMVHADMIDALAEAAAEAGEGWPVASPMVGALGTFVTGSATASNILFTDFQVATAAHLDFDPLRLVGAQGFGAAVGNIVAPHNIIAGCATVGMTGREGDVLVRTLGACAIYLILGGLLARLLVG